MKNKKIIDNFIDVESASLAAAQGLPFEKSGLEDNKKNRELFRLIQAETQKLLRGGVDVDIPS